MNVLLGVLSASEVLAVYWKLRVFNEVSNNALNVRSTKNAMLGRYWNGVIDGILGFPSFSISILCHEMQQSSQSYAQPCCGVSEGWSFCS